MAKKMLVNLDLSKNQILNVALQNLSSPPSSPVQGQIYYNTGDKAIYYWDGIVWVNVSGDISEVIAGSGLTGGGASGSVTLDVNVDNATIEVDNDIVRVKDLGITSAKLNNGAVTTIKIGDNQVTLGKLAQIANNTVIGNTSGGTANPSEVTIVTDLASASSTTLATSSSIKTYIDNIIGGLGNLEGGWDVAVWFSFPQATFPATIKKGDYWYATTAGVINTNTFTQVKINIGDVFIAKIDNAQSITEADWIVLETNRDQATETVLGVAAIATQIETDAGTNDQKFVTPFKLKTLLDNRTGGYATNIGDGSLSSYVVTHNLGTIDVIVMLKDNLTNEEVFADVVITDLNNVTVSFASAPAFWAYRVIIKK
jgi:hypothetical protein